MAISTEVQNTTLPNPGLSKDAWRKKKLKSLIKAKNATDPVKIQHGQKYQP
jgi:hypothetical protein